MNETCHNCGAVLHGHFCARCGQEVLPLNPRLRDVITELAHELLDVDGRIFRSVRKLFLAPGFLTREQFEGRRVPWLSPLRLYMIFSVAYFAIVSLGGGSAFEISIHTTRTQGPEGPIAASAEDLAGLRKIGFQSEQELRDAISGAIAVWMPRVMFVLVPLFAALVHVVRRKSGRTYPQHLQFALHAHAAFFGAAALAVLIAFVVPAARDEGARRGILLVGWAIYLVMAIRTAYGGTTKRALLHAAILALVYGLAIVLSAAAIVVPVVLGRQ